MATSRAPFPTASDATESQGDTESDPGARLPRENDTLERVTQGAHETIDRVARKVAPHVQKLDETVTQANETLKAQAAHARELGDEWTESLRCTVRDHPLAAIATALAVGIVVARITR